MIRRGTIALHAGWKEFFASISSFVSPSVISIISELRNAACAHYMPKTLLPLEANMRTDVLRLGHAHKRFGHKELRIGNTPQLLRWIDWKLSLPADMLEPNPRSSVRLIRGRATSIKRAMSNEELQGKSACNEARTVDVRAAACFAIDGDVGQMLEGCRQYLELIADAEVGSDLRAKMGVSDLVQETFLEAQKDFSRFGGASRGELLAWLRQILLYRISRLYGRYRHTQKRRLAREFSAGQTSQDILEQLFDSEQTSPSGYAMRAEKVELVRRAIDRLPTASRNVVLLRYRDRLNFSEIATKLGRSPDAVRMLWHRAIDRLADELET
jgi:RNA polymerase sigma-70 factor (ECF subfamily)